MSYLIRIGETFPQTQGEDMWLDVKDELHLEAPKFPGDDTTGQTNERSPSYLGWSQFCEKAGLIELFHDKTNGLMRRHPGCFPLTQKHLLAVKDALKKWKAKHPDTTPGWCECKECRPYMRESKTPHVEMDYTLARLLWLEYWISWALETCKSPAVFNC